MSTCDFFGQWSVHVLSQDDWQGLQRENGNLDPHTITANLGFNRGNTYFGKTSNSTWTMNGAVLRWRPNQGATGQKFYQTTAVAGALNEDDDDPFSYDVRINWARPFSGVASTVWASVYARPVNYSLNGCASSNFPSDERQNGTRAPSSTWYFKGDLGEPVQAGTSTMKIEDIEPTFSMTSSDIADIQLRVSHNAIYTSGTVQYLEFDNIRIREW